MGGNPPPPIESGSTSLAVPAPSTSPPPVGSTRPGRWALAAVLVALVVLLSVLLVSLQGGGGSGPGGGPLTFSGATVLADRVIEGQSGSWDLVEVLGIDLANSTTFYLNSSEAADCNTTWLVGTSPSQLTMPAFHGNLLSGDAPVWLLAYTQPATQSILEMIIVNGAVAFAAKLSGNCGASGIPVLPPNMVDSSTALSAAGPAGAAAFLTAHPTGVTVEMSAFGGGFGSGPRNSSWEIVLTTCGSFLSGSGSGSQSGYLFSVGVNATTGAVIPGTATNTTCGTSPPLTKTLGESLALGAPTIIRGTGTGGTYESQGCTSADYCYSIPIEGVANNVTPDDFFANVTNPDHALFPTVGFALLTASGQVWVYSAGPLEFGWTGSVGSPSQPLTVPMTLLLDMGTQNPSGMGLLLSLEGVGPFSSSSIGIGLP